MRHNMLWVFLLLVTALVAGCGTTDKSTAPQDTNPFAPARVGTDSTLEVVTWNVENFPKNGQTTVTDLAEAVEGLDADIVAMQEIESILDFRAVDAALPGYEGYRASSAYADLNLAFLYKTGGKLNVESIYEILTDEDALPRHPLVLQGTFGEVPVAVINNHYKCCGDNHLDPGDPWDEETRRLRASQVLQGWIEDNLPGMRVIVVGDFNDELTDPAADNVFQNFLDDPVHYRFADMAIAEGPSDGWSYPAWPSHLDHILVTSALFPALEAAGSETRVVRLYDYFSSGWSAYDKNLSDHLPVFVRLHP